MKSLLPIIECPPRESIQECGGRALARSYGKYREAVWKISSTIGSIEARHGHHVPMVGEEFAFLAL